MPDGNGIAPPRANGGADGDSIYANLFYESYLQKYGKRTSIGIAGATDADARRDDGQEQTKDPIMFNTHTIVDAIRRGLACSGLNALATAGYSESVAEAFEEIAPGR